MIHFFLKFSIRKQLFYLGKHLSFGLICYLIVVFSGLLIPSHSYAFFNIGDKVMVQNNDGLNIRENADINSDKVGFVHNNTMGTIVDGPDPNNGVDWYQIDWNPAGHPTKWSAASWNGCQYLITPERAKKKDEIVAKLFKLDPNDTNHDYNEYGCMRSWEGRVSGYIGGHSGWDVQTTSVAGAKRTVDAPFFSLTDGEVIVAGGRFGTIAVHNADDKKTVLYLHARRIDVRVGNNVSEGDRLGIQGNTGIALPAAIPDGYQANPDDYPDNYMEHVHIEVIVGKKNMVPRHGATGASDPNFRTIDPIDYLFESVSKHVDITNPPEDAGPTILVLEGHTRRINSVAFSPNGRTLASGSNDDTIRLWDTITGNYKQTLVEHTQDINDVVFSPNGRIIAGGSDDDNVYLWNATTGSLLQTFEGHTSKVNSVAFSPDGHTLASGSNDDTIRLWDVNTRQEKQTLEGHRGGVYSVAFSPDGRTLASGGNGEIIHLWDTGTGKHKQTLIEHTQDINDVAFSPNGRIIAGGSVDDNVYLWDATTGILLQTFEGHTDWVNSVAFSPDGRILASGSDDYNIHLWNTTTGEHVQTFEGHTDYINSVAFSPNGRVIASAGFDDTIRIWRVDTRGTVPARLAADVNADGSVNILDLVFVATHFGQKGVHAADVNEDGVVNIQDLLLVVDALGDTVPGAPSTLYSNLEVAPTRAQVQKWLSEARQLNLTDAMSHRGILFLEQLLTALTPKVTALLPNYPNPFNPETWIPYQLEKSTDVSISIFTADGKIVRTLALGSMPAGIHTSRSQAAYWDGKNQVGEPIASGVYFYTLTAGDFIATRKMLIMK